MTNEIQRQADRLNALLVGVKNRIRVTKVVATRSVKGQRGDSFAGFSAAFDSVQEDGGQGLLHVGDTIAEAASGMTTTEARIAHYLLALQADVAAYEAAWAGGSLSDSAAAANIRTARARYAQLIKAAHNQGDHPLTPKATRANAISSENDSDADRTS